MSKKQEFIDFIELVLSEYNIGELPENVRLYWDAFRSTTEAEKPMFTDNGKLVLQFLKDHPETSLWKARDIAEGLFISSRTVSGSMRKLVSDGFVEKVGSEPTIYSITELGKNVEIK
jgi:DNA-binding MarR family transcriptional regulator